MAAMIYLVDGTDQKVIVHESVVKHINQYRQIGIKDPESGGQLFARVTSKEVVISLATGPYKEDRKSRFRLTLNRWRQRSDIRKLFRKGLHFVGEWHTHPEKHPSPSSLDLDNMQECFERSKHQLESFIMMIVGTDGSERGLWLSQHNGSHYRQLDFSGFSDEEIS